MKKHKIIAVSASLLLFFLAACQPTAQRSGVSANPASVQVAQFTPDQRLIKPDVTEWVFMGSSLGLGYAPGAFRNDRPGTFQIVHMEPQAYQHFMEHGEYADGSMFSLSFYDVQEKPAPELNGFAQGELNAFEIHLIDSSRFIDQRGFYLFDNNAGTAQMVPPDNECVQCHNEHADYNGTFTQFYPPALQILSTH